MLRGLGVGTCAFVSTQLQVLRQPASHKRNETDLVTTTSHQAALFLTYFDVILGRMTTTFSQHRIMCRDERLTMQQSHHLGAAPALFVPFQWLALLVENSYKQVNLCAKEYQWIADGSRSCFQASWDSLSASRYLPVKRNPSPHLKDRFDSWALTVLYRYVTGLGGSTAAFIGNFPADVAEKWLFANNFSKDCLCLLLWVSSQNTKNSCSQQHLLHHQQKWRKLKMIYPNTN